MNRPELLQFRASHFNEKGRWALDYKGIEHKRRSLLPGPHKLILQRLSGQSQVPALKVGDQVIAGSDRIIEHLENTQPERPLYPADLTLRRRALEIQKWFDEEVGPAVRLAMFQDLLVDPGYFVRIFSWDQGALARVAYRAAFPAIRIVMGRQMGISEEAAVPARERIREGLDFVAREKGPDGHLAGDGFSVADLAAASLLAPTVRFDESPFGYPRPWPDALTGWWARWETLPGTDWVRGMYARHRGTSHEIAG